MNNHVFETIIFVFVTFVQAYSQSTVETTPFDNAMTISASDSSISSIITTTELTLSSVSYSYSTVTTPSSSSYSMSVVTNTSSSTDINITDNSTFISSTITISSIGITLVNTNTSEENFSSSFTSSNNSYITYEPTTSSINTIMINLTYKYIVESSSSLKIGSFNDSIILASVKKMVVSSFNQTYFNIIVTRIEIRSILKIDNTKYDMITDISFYCTRIDCNATHINQSVLSSIPTQNFTLFNVNDSLVDVTAQSSPTFVDNTENVTTTPLSVINYSKGESPPGVAAQLGMGVGITIIGILLIGEIIYFYRKYGLNGSMHHSNYALPPFHRQLSI
ncbi:unnamed protein product [Rotaria sordida]|uniref:Mid2 domain-containing protein n=1 Tax=Rotaria sordida TaxID=392033 RepID=A0A815AKT5_9BILA|nr:unnamed protein product [Rotaria sordida]CAF1537451.1 unnamed protein product [Rotaria sordida]